MRLLIGIVALGILGCCLSPTPAPTPPPAATTPAPSALTQALAGMTDPPAAPVSTPPAPTEAAPAPASLLPAVSPACLEARAGLEQARADAVAIRASAGGTTSQQVESTGAAMTACNADMNCLKDTKLRLARIDAYDRAQAALEADQGRLAHAELGIFEADRRVTASCRAP